MPLARIASQLGAAVNHVALLCSREGRLDPQRRDAHQCVCYELAPAIADLLAAGAAAVDARQPARGHRGLALAFVNDAIGQLLDRLAHVLGELGFDTAESRTLADGPEVARLRGQAAGVLMLLTRADPDRTLGHRGLSLMPVERLGYQGHELTYEQPQGWALQGRAIPAIGYRVHRAVEPRRNNASRGAW